MKSKSLPSREYLLEIFIYNEITGSLVWKRRPIEHFKSKKGHGMWNAHYAGIEVSSLCSKGYKRTKIDSVSCKVHRLIWKIMTGDDPVDQIDHINLNKADNRWENLRIATNSNNQHNTLPRRDNKTGCKGVHYCERFNKYVARINFQGKRYSLGYFSTVQDAISARKNKAKKLSSIILSTKQD